MAVALGKRKRVEAKAPPATKSNKRAAKDESDDDAEDLRDAFRRAFEAKFKPLAGTKKETKTPAPAEEDESDNSDDDEWEGLSGEEDNDNEPTNTVEVVEVTSPTRSERISKGELKAFMSSKPPSAPKPASNTDVKAADDDNDAGESDAKNLKNDLALQRLLRESHLLDASTTLSGPTGKNRHRATDLRIQALGSKGSALTQDKMPMAHRKGITAKATAREDKRRREARENGIILERATKTAAETGDAKKRERGVGGPGVGRFSGGTLKLSKKDVASITGEGRGGGGGRGGRGGRGGKKGRR